MHHIILFIIISLTILSIFDGGNVCSANYYYAGHLVYISEKRLAKSKGKGTNEKKVISENITI